MGWKGRDVTRTIAQFLEVSQNGRSSVNAQCRVEVERRHVNELVRIPHRNTEGHHVLERPQTQRNVTLNTALSTVVTLTSVNGRNAPNRAAEELNCVREPVQTLNLNTEVKVV